MSRTLKYTFKFNNGKTWEYELQFDDTHRYIPKPSSEMNPWTKLEFHKCSHCPLNETDSPQCPIARNLDQVVEDSKSTLSTERAVVTVETSERTYSKECPSADGLRSLFGLLMASSGCPHLDWLRPLARFHLPFSDTEETLFRVLSLQLLEEFIQNDGTLPGSECAKMIEKRYQEVEKVNHQFVNRIRSYCKADADKNAIAALDVFVQLFGLHFQNDFQSLRKLFMK